MTIQLKKKNLKPIKKGKLVLLSSLYLLCTKFFPYFKKTARILNTKPKGGGGKGKIWKTSGWTDKNITAQQTTLRP